MYSIFKAHLTICVLIDLLNIFYLFYLYEELNFNKDLFLHFYYFCLDKNYATFYSKIFHQICGFGMRTNYSNIDADLFLFYFECKYTKQYYKSLKVLSILMIY